MKQQQPSTLYSLLPGHARIVVRWDNLLAIYTGGHWLISVLRDSDPTIAAEVRQLPTAIHFLRHCTMQS